jgi:DNA-directed RNA polymerase specialized sigma24 family protein
MAFTKRFTADREESSDLVQDTLLKALVNKHKYRRDTNLQGWLFTITFTCRWALSRTVFFKHGKKFKKS